VYTRNTTETPGSGPSVALDPGEWSEAIWHVHHGAASPRILNVIESLTGGFLQSALPPSPASMLAALRSGPGTVHELGKGKVEGVDAVHYVTSIPYSDLGPQTASTRAMEHALGERDLKLDYWVDSHGRLRQLELAISISHIPASTTTTVAGEVRSSSVEAPVSFSVKLQLPAYGVPVSILIPPRQSVTTRQSCVITSSGTNCQ
jgi:hypothetical protein